MNHIVKRAGHTEKYDQRKLYASIFSSCIAVRESVGGAELISAKVCEDVEKWIGDKIEITSADIHRNASKHLSAYNVDAGWMYKHHRNVS